MQSTQKLTALPHYSGFSLPPQQKALNAVLDFMGLLSLLIYMTHQPILTGLSWLYVQVASPHLMSGY